MSIVRTSPSSRTRALATSSWVPAMVDAGRPVIGQRNQGRAVDSADAGHQVHAVLLLHVTQGVAAGQAAAQTDFHDLVRVQAGAARAAEGPAREWSPGGISKKLLHTCLST